MKLKDVRDAEELIGLLNRRTDLFMPMLFMPIVPMSHVSHGHLWKTTLNRFCTLATVVGISSLEPIVLCRAKSCGNQQSIL